MRRPYVLAIAFVCLVVGSLFPFWSWHTEAQVTLPPVGRYQLFQGHADSPQGGTSNSIFRIDTSTGRTEIYIISKDKEGKTTEAFVPIS